MHGIIHSVWLITCLAGPNGSSSLKHAPQCPLQTGAPGEPAGLPKLCHLHPRSAAFGPAVSQDLAPSCNPTVHTSSLRQVAVAVIGVMHVVAINIIVNVAKLQRLPEELTGKNHILFCLLVLCSQTCIAAELRAVSAANQLRPWLQVEQVPALCLPCTVMVATDCCGRLAAAILYRHWILGVDTHKQHTDIDI